MNKHPKKRGRQQFSVLASVDTSTSDDDEAGDSPCANALKKLKSMRIDNDLPSVGTEAISLPWRHKRSRIDSAIDNVLRKQRKLIENNVESRSLHLAQVLPDPRTDLRLQQLEVFDTNLILSRAFIPIDCTDDMQETKEDRPTSHIIFGHSSQLPKTRHAGDVSHADWFISNSYDGEDGAVSMSFSDDGDISD